MLSQALSHLCFLELPGSSGSGRERPNEQQRVAVGLIIAYPTY